MNVAHGRRVQQVLVPRSFRPAHARLRRGPRPRVSHGSLPGLEHDVPQRHEYRRPRRPSDEGVRQCVVDAYCPLPSTAKSSDVDPRPDSGSGREARTEPPTSTRRAPDDQVVGEDRRRSAAPPRCRGARSTAARGRRNPGSPRGRSRRRRRGRWRGAARGAAPSSRARVPRCRRSSRTRPRDWTTIATRTTTSTASAFDESGHRDEGVVRAGRRRRVAADECGDDRARQRRPEEGDAHVRPDRV